MANRIPIYIAAPLGAGRDRESNRRRAALWCAFLAERYACSPIADWVVLSGVWDESYREIGLECDRALVELVGIVVAVGGRWSPGMMAEAGWAAQIVDLTDQGLSPLSFGRYNGKSYETIDALCHEMDARMAAAGIARANG